MNANTFVFGHSAVFPSSTVLLSDRRIFHDAPQALPLLAGLAPAVVIADRGYDSDPLVAALAADGSCAVIPPRRKRRHPRPFDAARYDQRHPVERLFSRLKQFRRVATRYDKRDAHFLTLLQFAATGLWLRDC
jgi:transposase